MKLNRYTCQKCRQSIITEDRDEGVTPFMLFCRATPNCDGTMFSAFYRGVQGEPQFIWRKPTEDEYATATPEMRDHYDQGGLDIYPARQPEC